MILLGVMTVVFLLAVGFVAGAKPREKRIAELEQQVSKLEKYARWWIEENMCS